MNWRKALRWGRSEPETVRIHRRPIRPELEFHLNLGILQVYTALWRDALNQDVREYVHFFFEFWGREIVSFRLYETGLSIMMRRNREL